ncbi:radical SAM family heme chaperone HemW [Candidatus Oleimmundimicrobium sp.]|uniref:radical SAM family heme chaperone HemW n=1 Tax=Candidatus Oleimmundimicrobium sp. TaxID=3060597 RepID=UPI00271EC6FA|nr:radical SAM family heme chaperone HemW [Candidatus Oleimmundimicrobium sp.]MDO8885852.1 radical SAM family heme chaperone HemW [Candidatus Oleimmundimicrobium sp.]
MADNKPLGLYIHIPFCKQKCNYCDFNSYSGLENFYASYVEAICIEIEKFAQGHEALGEIISIYFGGGTPFILPVNYLNKIYMTCFSSFPVSSEIEITIEANPETITQDKLKRLRAIGFNRLSIGAQAFDNEMLKILGRKHSSEEICKSYSYAKKAGFDNVNLDLIFGIPKQTVNCWSDTLEKAVGLDPEHISAYCLEVHDGTIIHKKIIDGLFDVPEEDIQADMYLKCTAFLNQMGLTQYELSNFAKSGKECKHNLLYWKNENYLGFGAGAHSHLGNWRYKNIDSPIDYVKKLKLSESVLEKCEKLSDNVALSETLFLNLRLLDGINLNEFERKFGFKLLDAYGQQINDLIEKGLLVCPASGENLKLTKRGLFLANEVFAEFV